MSLDIEVDGLDFAVANVDMVVGRTLTGAERKLDGAEAIVGILFIDPTLALSQAIWDAKIPGEITTAGVQDEKVSFNLISSVDGVVVAGRTIADEFQWQEPVSNVPTGPGGGPGPGGGGPGPGGGGGPTGGGCFVAGTRLKAPGGPRPIELFEKGDPIMVWDFASGKLVESVVEDTWVHPSKETRKLLTDSGRAARLTDDQPLYTGESSKFAQMIQASSLGCLTAEEEMEADRICNLSDFKIEAVHHLHVSHPDHNYVLDNGIIAHNKGRYGDPWDPGDIQGLF